MGEVLANATAFLEECLDRSRDLGRLSIEAEIPVYFSHKIENRLQQRPSSREPTRSRRVPCPYALRTEDKLVRVETLLAMVPGQRLCNGLPGWRSGEIRPLDAVHFQFAAGLHDQAVVRFLQRKKSLNICRNSRCEWS